jgi:hypothetical protein
MGTGSFPASNKIAPIDVFRDPVDKIRVSTPQSLIDTDFEYSTQPSKWEGLSLVQNYPSFFPKGTAFPALDLVSVTGDGVSPKSSITVTSVAAHGLVVGDVIVTQDALNQLADGTFIIDTVPTSSSFTYTAKGIVNGSIQDTGYTTVYGGGIYNGARIIVDPSAFAMSYSGTTISVTTQNAHGLFPGTPIQIRGVSATTNAPNGNWVISRVATPNTFEFVVTSAPTGTLSAGVNFASCLLYTRPEGYQLHRSTDGGVLITTGGNYTGSQQIRQTRRYFRYQSGKGVQFSSGAKFTPAFDIATISASGTTVSISTLQDHNLQVGASIRVEGLVSGNGAADSAIYNIETTVTSVTGTKSFTYSTLSVPSDLQPGGVNAIINATRWQGAAVRSGMFDTQNGFYFEYDGEQLWACVRNSIKELFGRLSVVGGSSLVTGTDTRFREQIVAGDFLVIKGQSYQVLQVLSDTQLRIAPGYLGDTRNNVKYIKTQTRKFPQSEWNIDKMDGTGKSGYDIDIAKMQMAYIDYTWYGAGSVRFGFRSTDGEIMYCHKVVNNNVNNAAYMRSGNLPARFEAINSGPYSRLIAGATAARGSTLNPTDTTLYVEDVTGWSTSGYLVIQDANNSELVSYTNIGAYDSTVRGYPITGLSRRNTFSIAGVNPTGAFSSTAYTYAGTAQSVTFIPDSSLGGLATGTSQVSVKSIKNTCAPVISHWGVSVIMDGRYDEDKSFLFTTGMNRYMSVPAGATVPLLAIRIAPSVDSGIGRNFGIREIINRMQLALNGLGLSSSGSFLVEGILNPATLSGTGLVFPDSWQAVTVGSGSLAQVMYWDNTNVYASTPSTATGSYYGGDKIFGLYTDFAASGYATSTIALDKVRDLGTSILSGNGSAGNVNPGFPTGPDILMISARNLSASGTANIAARISWTEAQA